MSPSLPVQTTSRSMQILAVSQLNTKSVLSALVRVLQALAGRQDSLSCYVLHKTESSYITQRNEGEAVCLLGHAVVNIQICSY